MSSATARRGGPPHRPGAGVLPVRRADLPWAHPIDGVVAYVDLTGRKVVKVIDEIELPLPTERGEWDAAPHAVPARTDLKPIEITQPEGRDFTVEGNQITWADWSFRFGFDVREGLSPCTSCRSTGGRWCTAHPSPRWWCPTPIRRRSATGRTTSTREYLIRPVHQRPRAGCDCLGEIKYFGNHHRRRERRAQTDEERT